jgi:UV DNA damage endonuclease
MRLGLVCLFIEEPIKFRSATARVLGRSNRKEQLALLSEICLDNALSLRQALEYCHAHKIGCFRVTSRLFPLKTHPETGYALSDLPEAKTIRDTLLDAGKFARTNALRLTMHPDQYVVLSSPSADVTERSTAELMYHDEIAEMIGVDVINIHGGGVYGAPKESLKRLEKRLAALPESLREKLTLENDDRNYTPSDLLPICKKMHVPLVYDIHHHRCLPDGLDFDQAMEQATATWNREPLVHISSPSIPWNEKGEHRFHHDYIRIEDFPVEWTGLDITVEVEAKAKEQAVRRLQTDLENLTK